MDSTEIKEIVNNLNGLAHEWERKKRVALYMRVSTDHQDTRNQEIQLSAFCAQRGWKVQSVYAETESGARKDRPELFRLLHDARGNNWDIVLAVKVDRIGRSLQDLIEIADNLVTNGKQLVFTDQDIDITSSSGRLMFQLLSAFAEYERQILIERTKAGQARARREGKKVGRPSLHHETRKRIIRMREEERFPIRMIADYCNVSVGTVHKVLSEKRGVLDSQDSVVHKTEV